MNKILKRILIATALLLAVILLAAGGYVLFLVASYERIPDAAPLEAAPQNEAALHRGEAYTALSWNIGFGAYNHDFSFFMDSGVMDDGTEVTGEHARAQSEQIVQDNLSGVTAELTAQNADLYLLQEVDEDATRSYHIDERAQIRGAFPQYTEVFASNYHTAFLPYPFHEPIGAIEAGVQTLSRYHVDEAVRRSYPIDESFPAKFFDLDRCFALQRLPVEGGGQLVLINSHMSAYDEGGTVRAAQMEMLCGVLAEEYEAGNWVVVGGDFNHVLSGGMEAFESEQQVPEWVHPLPGEELPEGFSVVRAENAAQVPTCRSTDIPYTRGVNYTAVLDGFIVSPNVTAEAENIDTDFAYSDHNPVIVRFILE